MPDTDNRKQIAVLVKSPGSALQEPSSGLVRRAIQDVDRLINLDTVPIPLGIEGQDGLIIPLFKKGTVIPCETLLAIALDRGVNGEFDLNVFQGFSPHIRDNVSLCRIHVQNDSALTHQWPVHVKLAVDGNGILTVEVIDPKSKKSCEVRITDRSGGLSRNEITDLEKKWKK